MKNASANSDLEQGLGSFKFHLTLAAPSSETQIAKEASIFKGTLRLITATTGFVLSLVSWESGSTFL